MPSIRSLLDTFGQPPREICLDWAWQIDAACRTRESSLAEGPGAESLLEHDDWTALPVTSDGTLELARLNGNMAARALADLGSWMGDDKSVDSAAAGGGFASITTVPAADRACVASRASLIAHNRPRHRRQHVTWPVVRARLAEPRCQLLVAAVAVGSTLLMLLAWFASSAPLQTEGTAHAASVSQSDSSSAQAIEDAQHDLAVISSATVEPLITSAELVPGGSIDIGSDSDPLKVTDSIGSVSRSIDQSNTPAVESSREFDLRLPSVLPTDVPSKLFPANESASIVVGARAESSAAQPPAADSEPVGEVSPSANSAPSALPDVMADVAQALAEAESHAAGDADAYDEPHADQNEDENDSSDWRHQPAIAFIRDRIQVRCQLPLLARQRPHNPHWSVHIDAGEEFACEPQAAQTLAPRSSARFRIFDREAESPRACIIALATNCGGRDAALEWHFSGGAEDLPALQLPIARKWLDPLAAHLKLSVLALQTLSQPVPPTASGELRSALQNRRRLATERLKLTERLLTIIAELDRLAMLVDGEVEVRAQLRDGPNGSEMLSYGGP